LTTGVVPTAWERTSNPDAAMTVEGNVCVVSGSTIARSGFRYLCPMPVFACIHMDGRRKRANVRKLVLRQQRKDNTNKVTDTQSNTCKMTTV